MQDELGQLNDLANVDLLLMHFSGTTLACAVQYRGGRWARLNALLLSGQEADWTIKKGALWWFSTRTRAGETQTVLRAVIGPDMF